MAAGHSMKSPDFPHFFAAGIIVALHLLEFL
jgi:hypothetical protein